jgi:hypothetical protein
MWGGWFLVTAVVFSFSQGVIHTYYTVALAPAIAALVAIGGAQLWERRAQLPARALAAATVALTAGWSFTLLDRTPSWQPWVRVLVLVAALIAVVGLLAAPALARWGRRAGVVALAAVAVAMLGGPAAYAMQTVTTNHSGSTPSAGPTVAGAGAGGPFGGGAGGGLGAGRSGVAQGLFGGTGSGARAGGSRRPAGAPSGTAPSAATGGGFAAGSFTGGGVAGGQITVSSALVRALETDASSYRWVAATTGSSNAASYELATGGDPVMAIGGFDNNGGLLSLAQFIRYVRAGDIHYYISSGGGGSGPIGGGSSSGTTSEISSWVAEHYTATTIGGVTVYDLTK